ncbi:uncharacterized protein BX663DRAFT_338558 [Cokeromyces recurvatus]|uniref:uncharacterized protein n=1 Tax=Cokeromyces recurvatus TaxID=90255 RepID=UPI00221F2EF6|nr:uncharacterized protein BX663DRAFT_338558 [Cokeromyces recurvatus]KAI7904310.1 hypothetical protein BX663DRAFT_338558 [Cokeromyces recurvatus]
MTPTKEDIWFSGPVQDAISLVNERNCVFLVYIYDDSEKTNALNNTLKDEKVIEEIRNKTVALAMEKDSENVSLFSQFYPVKAIPILYFIQQGTIKDFGTETITSEEIIKKIDFIMSNKSNEDKKAELQRQLEKVRKERAEREQREAKEKEIKRRQEAKMMQEAKQLQQDKETQIYLAKLKKERQEEEAHRKKVREQIARDRAEKMAKRNIERQQHQNSFPFDSNNAEKVINNRNRLSSSHSNLSIRQLDGSNIRHQFEENGHLLFLLATATLLSVKEWIDTYRTDEPKRPYKLSSQFPTRLFTEEDHDTTLKELNLCPSATIIMKPMKAATNSSSFFSSIHSHGISSNNHDQQNILVRSTFYVLDFMYGILMALWSMLLAIWDTLSPKNRLTRQENVPSQQQATRSSFGHLRGGQRLGGESSVIGESSSANTRREYLNESSQRHRNNPYGTRINTLQEGEQDKDDDKKRTTYNGNSINQE